MTSHTVQVTLIVKEPSFFKTETKLFKINNHTTWKQIYDTLMGRDGIQYNFLADQRTVINLDEKVVNYLNIKMYAISQSSSEYNIESLIFLSETVLDNHLMDIKEPSN
jgi:hypothetical protein